MELFLIILLLPVLQTLATGASSDGFYFTVNPKDQDVEEGQSLRLRCAVTPSKDIYYSWLHNGHRVDTEQENGRRYLEMERDLQIVHADRNLDPGNYQCQALNKSSLFTTASKEAKVNIFWMEPDVSVHLVKPEKIENIRLGQEVEFACHVQANPPLSPTQIKWYHNGNARLPNTEFLRNGNLRISVLGIQHTGSYHCRVVHAAGKLDSRPPFILQFDDADPPQLITSMNREDFSKYVMRGQSVELVCPKIGAEKTAGGMPPITVWGYMPRLGEKQQSLNTLVNVKLTDMESKLIIDKFDIHHVNYYTCEISWLGSQDRHIFLFQVELATLFTPKLTEFSPRLKKNQPYVVRLTENAEIRYYPDQTPTNSFMLDKMTNPPPEITWTKNDESKVIPPWSPPVNLDMLSYRPGSPVPMEPRVYALRGRHLIINQVTEADRGTYQLTLTNMAGRISVDFDLLVTAIPEFHQPLNHAEHSYDEDDTVSLNCGVKRRSIPGSIVYWEKDQKLLEQHSNSLMIIEGDGEVLRFPKVKPVDQGQYQCFVQTDGYKQRSAGHEQTLVVKAKLQFINPLEDYFLELNTHGRLPCRVRGYGQLQVTWFRKVGGSDLQPIIQPNQIEAGGTLLFKKVRKTDSGDYVCVATSNYKNARRNMTVQLVVGEKPKIPQISPNQTVRVGDQLILSCHATGDPEPQISWIRRGVGTFHSYKPHSDTDKEIDVFHGSNIRIHDRLEHLMNSNQQDAGRQRVRAYPNGSLVIKQANLIDQTEYICVATNTHAVETRQGLFVRVLSPEEYTRWQLGEEGSRSNGGMLKTMLTVVGCAVAYLGLIIVLTVFCSMRMVRKRRKRSDKAHKTHENGQLLSPVGESNAMNCVTTLSHTSAASGPGNTMETGFIFTGMGSGTSGASGSTSYATSNQRQHLHNQLQQAQSINPMIHGTMNGIHYEKPYSHQPLQFPININGSNRSPLAAPSQLDSQDWWPWQNDASYFNPTEMQPKVPHGTPAGPLDTVSEPNTDSLGGYAQTLNSTPCHYAFYNGQGENSVNTTTASEPQLMSAPPPTPLDSRSYFSGLSSGNSTSLYSHSVVDGTSNFCPTNHGTPLNSANERMFYPRNELQKETTLGNGSFGEVFYARARQIRNGDSGNGGFLVKSLASREAAHVNEFHRQVEMFGKVHHPNVTQLFAVCFDQEPFYMLLDYCEMGDLKSMLRRMRDHDHTIQKMTPLTLGQKLSMCKQVAMGMEHLSQLRCVHRDLAARNILLTADMEIKISHLGLCRDVHSTDYYRLPNTDQYIPLRWFAPELIAEALPTHTPAPNSHQLDYGHSTTGPSLPYTTCSDIWAFGVVVCEIFSFAMLPLNRLNDAEIVAAGRQTAQQGNQSTADNTVHHPAPLRPDIPAELPTELNNLLLRCCSPVIRQRPDFKEITNLLNDLLS